MYQSAVPKYAARDHAIAAHSRAADFAEKNCADSPDSEADFIGRANFILNAICNSAELGEFAAAHCELAHLGQIAARTATALRNAKSALRAALDASNHACDSLNAEWKKRHESMICAAIDLIGTGEMPDSESDSMAALMASDEFQDDLNELLVAIIRAARAEFAAANSDMEWGECRDAERAASAKLAQWREHMDLRPLDSFAGEIARNQILKNSEK